MFCLLLKKLNLVRASILAKIKFEEKQFLSLSIQNITS